MGLPAGGLGKLSERGAAGALKQAQELGGFGARPDRGSGTSFAARGRVGLLGVFRCHTATRRDRSGLGGVLGRDLSRLG